MIAGRTAIDIWLIIAVLTLVVIVTRNVFNFFGQRLRPQGRIAEALDFAPLAAIVAIVVPEFIRVFYELGETAFSFKAHIADGRLFAAATLLLVGLTTKNSLYALLAGSATYLASLLFTS